VRVDASGVQSYFNTDLAFTAGMHIVGDTLYACSSNGPYAGLIGFDLEMGEMIMNLALPGMQLLNDVTSDTSGYLYVTEYIRDWIYRVDISTQNNTVFVSDEVLNTPNGILFDAPNNRLLVINEIGGGNDAIYAVSLPYGDVTTVASLGLSSCDGLTEDNDGNIYFSSWATGRVYKYDHEFSSPYEEFSRGHYGPADIFYNKTRCEMAVPNYNTGRLELVLDPQADPDGDGVFSATDNCPWQPNPGQEDADTDSLGDTCDDCTDLDGDGYGDPGFPVNTCATDNCPGEYNPGQEDSDGDGVGDVCDCACPMQGDIDGDEFITALDLASEIDILFSGSTDPQDPDCPTTRGDFDCDGFTTALDMSDVIDHLFAGGAAPCDPCAAR
jgi:hypothetical protein